MYKILLIIGTRPEAIKSIPVYLELKENEFIDTRILHSGQHADLVDEVFVDFEIKPHYSFFQKSSSSIGVALSNIMECVDQVLIDYCPDLVIVHGDTLTAYSASLSSYFRKIPIAHIESGLRTNDIFSPYPEEFFRISIDRLSTLLFCPTKQNLDNLSLEGIVENALVTGNTGIDALRIINERNHGDLIFTKPTVLITIHRRESFGNPIKNMFSSINLLASKYPDFDFYIPLHPNPQVQAASRLLDKSLNNIIIDKPQPYKYFSRILKESYLVLSDSGGIQEETSFLGKPLIILRDKTERQEVLESNFALLVGTDVTKIIKAFDEIVNNKFLYEKMSKSSDVFGHGYASKIITQVITNYFREK